MHHTYHSPFSSLTPNTNHPHTPTPTSPPTTHPHHCPLCSPQTISLTSQTRDAQHSSPTTRSISDPLVGGQVRVGWDGVGGWRGGAGGHSKGMWGVVGRHTPSLTHPFSIFPSYHHCHCSPLPIGRFSTANGPLSTAP